MASQDYWVVKYKKTDGTKHLLHIEASYKWYDKEKIKAVYNELHPEWEILKIYPIDKIEFKTPDGG